MISERVKELAGLNEATVTFDDYSKLDLKGRTAFLNKVDRMDKADKIDYRFPNGPTNKIVISGISSQQIKTLETLLRKLL